MKKAELNSIISWMHRGMDTEGKISYISINIQHRNFFFSLKYNLIHEQQHVKISNKNK